MNNGPVRGFFSRSRDLRQFNERFPDLPLEEVIRRRGAAERSVRVLEVGCGEGRVIMQLRRLFPDIELVGINRAPWQAMTGPPSLIDTALHYGIFSAGELDPVSLPAVVFCDASRLDFPDDYFDVVYSQVAVQYIERKELFLAETWRTLKPGGIALLNVDSDSDDPEAPEFMRMATPRFVICNGKTVVPLSAVIEDAGRRGFDITYYPTPGREHVVNLIMRKNKADALSFNLAYVEAYSFDLRALIPESTSPHKYFWGFRSFYQVGFQVTFGPIRS